MTISKSNEPCGATTPHELIIFPFKFLFIYLLNLFIY